jgi:peptidoglycan L-alanyl-D-glutamate endopeptidase CwlK
LANRENYKRVEVILLVIFFYFALIVSGVILIVFPEFRMRVFGAFNSTLSTANQRLSHTVQSGTETLGKTGGAVRNSFALSFGFLRTNLRLSAAAILVIVLPPLIALAVRGPTIFAFDDDAYTPDHQISVLLEGEHLVPPPPLPPELFTTREVEQERPDIVHASRNWAQLDSVFTQRLLLVMKIMRERYGYDMALIEGYRSPERQAELAAGGGRVTNAGAYMSYHQYGLAADCAFYRDGKIVISERDPIAMKGYKLYGEVAESVGLTWGGRWKLHDYGHVELHRKGVLGQPLS